VVAGELTVPWASSVTYTIRAGKSHGWTGFLRNAEAWGSRTRALAQPDALASFAGTITYALGSAETILAPQVRESTGEEVRA
jgi:hypothetical protein